MLSFALDRSEVLEGAFCCKDTEAERQTVGQAQTVWKRRKHIFWWRDTRVLEGRILWSTMFTHEWNFPTEFSAFPLPSYPVLCFGSILMICSLIWLRQREAMENLVSVCSWLTAWWDGCHKGGCLLDNQSLANLISCCHTIFPLTITAPPLPSTPLPLLCQSWFSCIPASFFLADGVYFKYHIIGKAKILTPNSFNCDWGFGCADAQRRIIDIRS